MSDSEKIVQPIIDGNTFEIWLGTNPTLRKTKEIEKNPHLTVAFGSDSENANLIVYGKASIIRDVQVPRKWSFSGWDLGYDF